jgi:hypothetical protein
MYCHPIDFKIDLFRVKDFFTPSMRLQHSFLRESDLNPDLVDIFESLGLIVSMIETFYLPPFIDTGIHVDRLGGDFTKINWIFKGKNSKMNWYEPLTPDCGITKTMAMGTLYQYFEHKDMGKIYEHEIQGSAVIQAGIPHNITTQEDERICVSLSYLKKGVKLMTMDETLEIFKNYLI